MNKKLSVQELYTFIYEDLQDMENIFLKLEKGFFSLTPVFDALEIRMERLMVLLKRERIFSLLRKVKTLYRVLRRLQEKRGYEPEIFQNLFISLNKIRKVSSDEVMSANSFKKKMIQFQNQAQRFLGKPEENEHPVRNGSRKFLMAIDNETRFLIPIKNRVWQKKIGKESYRDHLKIRLKNEGESDSYTFTSLIQSEREKKLPERYAVLISDENGYTKGFLSDQVEGFIYLNPRLFLEKLEYMSIDQLRTKSFIRLRGKRYFIKALV